MQNQALKSAFQSITKETFSLSNSTGTSKTSQQTLECKHPISSRISVLISYRQLDKNSAYNGVIKCIV